MTTSTQPKGEGAIYVQAMISKVPPTISMTRAQFREIAARVEANPSLTLAGELEKIQA